MIYSDEYKYVFMEVPHTASTAIARELTNHYGGRRVLRKHDNYSIFRAHCTPEQRRYRVFASVRNPLDAFVTEYYKFLNDHKGDYSNTDNYESNGGWIVKEHVEKYQFTVRHGDDFPAYFRKFLCSTYHNWFLLGHKRFDYVMRFENIAEEFDQMLSRIGVPDPKPLPVSNKSERPAQWHTLFDKPLQELAIKYYSPFFRQWGYEFPEDWTGQPSSLVNLKYHLSEAAVQTAGGLLKLDPRSPGVARVKAMVRKFI